MSSMKTLFEFPFEGVSNVQINDIEFLCNPTPWLKLEDKADKRSEFLLENNHFPPIEAILPERPMSFKKEDLRSLSPGQMVNQSAFDIFRKTFNRRYCQPVSNWRLLPSDAYSQIVASNTQIEEDRNQQRSATLTKSTIIDLVTEKEAEILGPIHHHPIHWNNCKNPFAIEFIYMAVLTGIHWRLLVVVNAGHVLDLGEDDPMCCVLCLDSRPSTKDQAVQKAKQVHQWLNNMWGKHFPEKTANPFNLQTMPIFAPSVPQQKENEDNNQCGICTMLNVVAMHKLCNVPIRRSGGWYKGNLTKLKPNEFGYKVEVEANGMRTQLRKLANKLEQCWCLQAETSYAGKKRKKY